MRCWPSSSQKISSRQFTIGKPSLLRSNSAASRSPCALRNSRCATSAGGTRILLIGTGRTFDGRRLDCCFAILRLLCQTTDERRKGALCLLQRPEPGWELRAIDGGKVDEAGTLGQVLGVHHDALNDARRVVAQRLPDRDVRMNVDAGGLDGMTAALEAHAHGGGDLAAGVALRRHLAHLGPTLGRLLRC